MATAYGKTNIGSFSNYNFELGSTSGWSSGASEIYSLDSSDDIQGSKYSLKCYSTWQSGAWNDEWIPVDTTKRYTLSYRTRTLNPSSAGRNMQSYIGFTCWDENFNFIDLRNCGDVGNTTLTRALNVGDEYVYIASNSGWGSEAQATYFKNILFYPPSHPKYGAPWKYTRIGYYDEAGNGELIFSEITQISGSEWRLKLARPNYSIYNPSTPQLYGETATTFPNYGYSFPVGTPVARGVAGGTYNYAFGYQAYPTTPWTTLATTFTGENRNSGTPFRYSTKYIRAMILYNYALPNDGGTYPYPEALFDRMIFLENPSTKDYIF